MTNGGGTREQAKRIEEVTTDPATQNAQARINPQIPSDRSGSGVDNGGRDDPGGGEKPEGGDEGGAEVVGGGGESDGVGDAGGRTKLAAEFQRAWPSSPGRNCT